MCEPYTQIINKLSALMKTKVVTVSSEQTSSSAEHHTCKNMSYFSFLKEKAVICAKYQ